MGDTAAVPVRLHTLRWGAPAAARRALLVHGLGSAAGTWWRIADALARAGYAVTAPDLRGHGSSPRALSYRVDEYVADLRLLGTGWDLLIGHSLGGLLAAAVATPDFVRRVMLIDPVLDIADDALDTVLAEQLAELSTAEAMAYLTANPRWHAQDAAAKAVAAAAVSPYVIERTLHDNAPWHFAHYAHRLAMPTLILAADPKVGTMFAPKLATKLTTANPNLDVRTVAGAGHSIHRDDPEVVLAAIEDGCR